MDRRTRLVLLAVGIALALLAFLPRLAAARLPGNDLGYAPAQPLAFSHRLHAGELQIGCLYCHAGAERSPRAGIPAAGVCMNCHKFVSAPIAVVREEDRRADEEKRKPRRIVTPEIGKLYAALGLDAEGKETGTPRPIAWERVYQLPAFAVFDHRPHVAAGVTCQRCHGAVETMERIRQESDLSMGWCVNCHRDVTRTGIDGKEVRATTDCAACHY